MRAQQGLRVEPRSLHMALGNPGTGMRTVGRLAGRVFAKNDLLRLGAFTEVGRADLIAEFIGQSASKTAALIAESLGGVLFVTEAPLLVKPHEAGIEALAVLTSAMEKNRNDLCVVFAGRPIEMEELEYQSWPKVAPLYGCLPTTRRGNSGHFRQNAGSE